MPQASPIFSIWDRICLFSEHLLMLFKKNGTRWHIIIVIVWVVYTIWDIQAKLNACGTQAALFAHHAHLLWPIYPMRCKLPQLILQQRLLTWDDSNSHELSTGNMDTLTWYHNPRISEVVNKKQGKVLHKDIIFWRGNIKMVLTESAICVRECSDHDYKGWAKINCSKNLLQPNFHNIISNPYGNHWRNIFYINKV